MSRKENPRTNATTGGFQGTFANRAAQGTGGSPGWLALYVGSRRSFCSPEIVAPFSQPDAPGLSQVSPLPVSTLTNCERSAKDEPQRSTGEGAEHERSYDSHDFAAPRLTNLKNEYFCEERHNRDTSNEE